MEDEDIAPNTNSWSSRYGQEVASVHYTYCSRYSVHARLSFCPCRLDHLCVFCAISSSSILRAYLYTTYSSVCFHTSPRNWFIIVLFLLNIRILCYWIKLKQQQNKIFLKSHFSVPLNVVFYHWQEKSPGQIEWSRSGSSQLSSTDTFSDITPARQAPAFPLKELSHEN